MVSRGKEKVGEGDLVMKIMHNFVFFSVNVKMNVFFPQIIKFSLKAGFLKVI